MHAADVVIDGCHRILAPVLLALALTGCASQPDAGQVQARLAQLSKGESVARVGERLDSAMRRPALALHGSDGDITVFAVSLAGEVTGDLDGSSTALVFDNARLIGTLGNGSTALGYSRCLGQPGGRELLTQRLRALCAGEPDPLAATAPESSVSRGEAACPAPDLPPMPARPPRPARGPESELARGAGETAFYSLGVILSPILVPAGLAALGGMAALDRQSLVAQEKLTLGMPGSDVARIMGKPDLALMLAAPRIEIRCYARKMNTGLCLGLEQDRLVWLGSDALMEGELRQRLLGGDR